MKEIPISRIGEYTGKKIRIDFEERMLVVTVMLSMGPMYFLIRDQKNIGHIYKGKISIDAKLYEL